MNTTTEDLTSIDTRMATLRKLLLSSAIALMVTGCASKPPTLGDTMERESERYGEISEKWDDGQKLVSKGNKRIKKGKNQIDDGEENIEEGEDMVQRGERMMRDSKTEYERKKGAAL